MISYSKGFNFEVSSYLGCDAVLLCYCCVEDTAGMRCCVVVWKIPLGCDAVLLCYCCVEDTAGT
jgi:hypothetical protein